MIHAAPSKKLIEEQNRLILKTGLSRNISFFVLFVILIISFILNFNPSTDFSGNQLPGTLLIISLIILTGGLSLLKWELVIDRDNHSIVTQYKVLSWQLTRENIPFEKLHGTKISQILPGGIPKYSIYQLFLIVECTKTKNGEREIMIYSNTNKSETERIREKISEFTGKPEKI